VRRHREAQSPTQGHAGGKDGGTNSQILDHHLICLMMSSWINEETEAWEQSAN
jgi:hypothetical protein